MRVRIFTGSSPAQNRGESTFSIIYLKDWLEFRAVIYWCNGIVRFITIQGHIPEESEDSDAAQSGGTTRVVVVDKETNTDTATRSRHRHIVQEQAARNSAIRRSQTFSPSGKVMPQICKVSLLLFLELTPLLGLSTMYIVWNRQIWRVNLCHL